MSSGFGPESPLTVPGPSVVRGHHSLILREFLLGEYADLDAVAAVHREGASLVSEPGSIRPGYYFDTYGPTKAGAERLDSATISFVETFVQLPDNAPVLASTGRDQICNSCWIGKHCDAKSNFAADKRFLRAITDTAAVLSLSHTVEQTTETVELRSGETRPSPALLLPASTARAVFTEPTYPFRTRRSLVRAELLAEHAVKNWLKKK